jgi:calcineurin-like phosphoesterase family protein
MSIFFTSDTHFYHKNIIKYENRPFNSVEEMNTAMIENWNETVEPNDEVYILGDFAFADGKTVNELLKRLNGKKYLIKGNHDSFLRDKDFDKSLFAWVKDYHVLNYNNHKYVLFHYPIKVWDCKHHDAIHCYGHVHSKMVNHHKFLDDLVNAYNVGVDVNDFTPISIDDLEIIKGGNGTEE